MWRNNNYAVDVCRNALAGLKAEGAEEVVLYGAGDVAKILLMLAKKARIKVTNIYDSSLTAKKLLWFQVLPLENLNGYDGKVIIASFAGIRTKLDRLDGLNIPRKNIIKLQ